MKKSKKVISILGAASVLTASLYLQVPCANALDSISKYDLNSDGKVNSTDLAILKRCVLGIDVKVSGNPDINGDGKTNSLDYVLLKKYITTPAQQSSEDVYKANTNFAFDIFKELNKEDATKNVTISPLSISTAISMAYQGANGTTKDAISNALRYKGLDISTVNNSYKELFSYLNQADPKVQLAINNSIWYRDGLKVKDDFMSVNKDVFSSYIASLDFSNPDSANKINGWISTATKGKISNMINPPIPSDVLMYLINAVYFKGQWTEVFDPFKSTSGSFQSGDSSIKNVVYMKKRSAGEYGSGTDYKAVRLPYGSGNIAMYCILPNENVKINDFISTLDSDKWNSIKKSISKSNDLELTLPRFKVEYGSKSLKESLNAMGMGEAFKSSADFSGITSGIYIDDVLHKSIVEVNEKGTEAAAVTVVIMPASIPTPASNVFSATRPFVFVIADDKTGTLLFMGKTSDIEGSDSEEVNINSNYNWQNVILKKGQKLKLALESNGSNGYTWDYVAAPDQTVLKSGETSFVPYSDSVGSSGTSYWEYEAVGTGNTEINLKYERSWLTSDTPLKTFKVKVTVK
ncbi:MAG TPA: serpin family protein [Clostridia bacterium]